MKVYQTNLYDTVLLHICMYVPQLVQKYLDEILSMSICERLLYCDLSYDFYNPHKFMQESVIISKKVCLTRAAFFIFL